MGPGGQTREYENSMKCQYNDLFKGLVKFVGLQARHLTGLRYSNFFAVCE